MKKNLLMLVSAFYVMSILLLQIPAWGMDKFYGYYTRLDYIIPIEKATDYIPTELTEESQLIIERMKALESAARGEFEKDEEDEVEQEDGQEEDYRLEEVDIDDVPLIVKKAAEKKYPKQPIDCVEIETWEDKLFYHVIFDIDGDEAVVILTPQGEERDGNKEDRDKQRDHRNQDPPLTGQYADIVIQLGSDGQLVFSRETAYQPVWKTEKGKWPVKDIVDRDFDIGCLYSYARIIEQSPTMIMVHWRYMPDLKNVNLTSVVHEYFYICPDGTLERRIRQACKDLDDWNDPKNVTIQKLKLESNGIKEISKTSPQLSRLPKQTISGSFIKSNNVMFPAAKWQFDEGLKERSYDKKDITREGIKGIECPVNGDVTLWKKGVSGTALAFDGYKSSVVCPASKAPALNGELTLEAWVALGALPWNWAPLVHQSIVDPGPIEKGNYDEFGVNDKRKEGRGYYLGIGAHGYPIFTVNGVVLEGSIKIDPYRWTHVAASYGDGKMSVYVDGQLCGTTSAGGKIKVPDKDLLIGLNNVPGRATDPIRTPICHLARIYGIEGLIDEVCIYDKALNASQIQQSYRNLIPGRQVRDYPDLGKRTLPGKPGVARNFGAFYTDLGYHELWNIIWRESDYPDILVKFDTSPTSVAFWRGVNGGVGWVTENNKWMSDQSIETGGPHGCSEHMSDKENRHAHVRLIENTDARVVVHWRYASIDIDYLFPDIRNWTDEYYCIYPDCVAVRKVNFRNGRIGWHDVQFLNEPGTSPRDNIDWQALDVANLDGEVHKLTWTPPDGVPQNPMRDACISMVNLKSKYKVFLVYPGEGIGTWGRDEQSPHTEDPFAGPWNHWPVSQIRSDGRYAVSNDRLTHAALGGGDTRGDMAMYGLTDKPITELVPLARSWKNPPELRDTKGCSSEGYKMEERAYHLVAEKDEMSFSINANDSSPLVNPCFVVKDWNSQQKAVITIDGKKDSSDKKIRQGIVRDTQGKPMLVIWIETEMKKPIEMTIAKS